MEHYNIMSWENPSDTTWLEAYEQLAYEIESTFTDRPNAIDHIDSCVFIILNLNSIGIAGSAQIALLNLIHKWSWYARDEWAFDGERLKVIIGINKFTAIHYGSLTDFVNAIVWDNGCVPYNWTTACDAIGYDTSTWTVCS